MLGPVTAGCRQRLVAHYGQPVSQWLDRVPELLDAAARSWGLRVIGFHDAGHASALAVAASETGAQVVLKAWFDRDRYRYETTALRYWKPVNGRVLRGRDDERAIACLELVGGRPGGTPRPADDYRLVARALARMHAQPLPEQDFPSLDGYLRDTLEPRIVRRLRPYLNEVPRKCVDLGLNAVHAPTQFAPVLLHADLYRENVPFNHEGKPVFLDPLPMIGDAAFDWAFFVVYFDLAGDPVARLRAATEASGIASRALLPWCFTMCLDGLLYYREVGDDRERRMIAVMTALAAEDEAACAAARSRVALRAVKSCNAAPSLVARGQPS